MSKYSFLNRNLFISRFDEYYSLKKPFIFIVDFQIENFFIATVDELKEDDNILFDFKGYSNISKSNQNKILKINPQPIPLKDYAISFNKVQSHLSDGDSYLLNLTFPTKIEINATFEDIFYSSKADYKLKFYDNFVFFSPERFVLIKDKKIFTHPMKGTKVYENDSSVTELLNDEKEMAEHLTIVDLLRNDLSMIADDVKVNRFRYVSYIKTVDKTIIQTSSEIEGTLKDGSVASHILQILPAGSISGAPKRKTIEIIKNVEIDERGFYTGIAGVFDGDVIDTCVIIRYIERKGDKLIYRSGGGITIYSDLQQEYQEIIDKVYVPCF